MGTGCTVHGTRCTVPRTVHPVPCSFENGKKNFFGEKFDDIKKNLKNFWQGIEDEYDIVSCQWQNVDIGLSADKPRRGDTLLTVDFNLRI